MINTYLFDFDGVLVDTMEIQTRSLADAIEKYYGFQNIFDKYEKLFKSAITTKRKIDVLIEDGVVNKAHKQKIYDLKVEIADDQMLSMSVDDYQDKLSMLKYIKDKQYKVAIVTNANRTSTISLAKHLGFLDYIDVVITNNDVENPKPAPDPYNKAVNLLGSNKNHCVIFEDSETGIKSALSSGCNVVRVLDISQVNTEAIKEIERGKNDFYCP